MFMYIFIHIVLTVDLRQVPSQRERPRLSEGKLLKARSILHREPTLYHGGTQTFSALGKLTFCCRSVNLCISSHLCAVQFLSLFLWELKTQLNTQPPFPAVTRFRSFVRDRTSVTRSAEYFSHHLLHGKISIGDGTAAIRREEVSGWTTSS